jgi:hypothetical protein
VTVNRKRFPIPAVFLSRDPDDPKIAVVGDILPDDPEPMRVPIRKLSRAVPDPAVEAKLRCPWCERKTRTPIFDEVYSVLRFFHPVCWNNFVQSMEAK